jgi:AraC-like DNA-binding protein
MLYFSQQIVSTVVSDLSEGRGSICELHAPVVDDPRLTSLFVEVREAAIDPEGEPAFEERLLRLFGQLFGEAQGPVSVPTDRLSRVQERIDDAPARCHALVELAALAGLSRYQTLRGFARMTGLTPHAYVLQRRLDTARRLIRHGSNLADAAVEAGFADQSHMHRVFVRRHGFTPGAYADALRRPPAITCKRKQVSVR